VLVETSDASFAVSAATSSGELWLM
jgi:hypothetical protein